MTSKVQSKHDLEGETKVTNSSGSPPEVFCREKLYPFLHNLRWPLLICTLGLGAAALWGATKLETPKNNDVLLLGTCLGLSQIQAHCLLPLREYTAVIKRKLLHTSQVHCYLLFMEYSRKVTPLLYPIPDTHYEVHPHSPTRD